MTADARLIVALDYDNADTAWRLVESLGDAVVFYKVGLTLLANGGLDLAAGGVGGALHPSSVGRHAPA